MIIEIKMKVLAMDEILDLSKYLDDKYGDHEMTIYTDPDVEEIINIKFEDRVVQ